MLRELVSKAKEHWITGLLFSASAVALALKDKVANFATASFAAAELAVFVVIAIATLALALGWVAYLHVLLANRANASDYEIYHPNVGVTVFRIPEGRKNFDSDVWYCPKCLTVDHKLAHINARHDLSGVWECVNCKLQIHPVYKPDRGA